MNRLNRLIAASLSYLLIIGVSGLVSIYAIEQSMAAPIELIGNEGLSVDPVDAKIFDIDNMYPGKTVASEIIIKNESEEPFALDISLKLSGDYKLIDALELTVSDTGKVFYSGLITDMGLLTLGEITAGKNKKITFTLTFLPGHGNVTQNQSAGMNWIFSAVNTSGGGSKKPGNGRPTGPTIPDLRDLLPPGFTPASDIAIPDDLIVVPVSTPVVILSDIPVGESLIKPPVEEFSIKPKESQMPQSDKGSMAFLTASPLLLILLFFPLLILFILSRTVLVLAPGRDGKYKTVARKFARRRANMWYVNIEKELDKYLPQHELVVLDFRGGLLKRAEKSVYSGQTMIGTSKLRYALVGNHRIATWAAILHPVISNKVG